MSIKRREYLIPQIEIDIVDKGKYADIAFLIDREDFMKEIALLRKNWIGEKLLNHNKIINFINLNRDLSSTKHFWNNYHQVFKIVKKYYKVQRYKKKILKYNLNLNYISAVLSAALTGKVTDEDYTTALQEFPMSNTPDFLQLNGMVTYTTGRVREVDIALLNEDNKSIAKVQHHRKWYWLYQKMGYRKIAKHLGINIETIRSGVHSYIQNLQTYYQVV